MIKFFIIFLAIKFDYIHTVHLFNYDEASEKHSHAYEFEFEPVTTLSKDKEKIVVTKNINCDDFSSYALNCTSEAAILYNSSKRAPPMPWKIPDWCKAMKHVTNCAIDWNADCRDVTGSHFNEESIKGHMHVLEGVCDDETFIFRYEELANCIEGTTEFWEDCYRKFKEVVDERKNITHEWTHFETHFYLCCARAKFRRCVLEMLFAHETICGHTDVVTLQQFSVIVSEGDVFQDCEFNMMYNNCPGGDPRPPSRLVHRLMTGEVQNGAVCLQVHWYFCIVIFYLLHN